ncbi:MAG: hypothetical protein U0893_07750 [Chloroflexota bacterium]
MKYRRRTVLGILGSLPAVLLMSACQSAPQAAPAASAGPAAAKLFLAVDMVQGSKNVPSDRKAISCTLASRFARNSEMVWRARVYDPSSGDLVDGPAMDKVQVKLANGQTLDAVYGTHPKDPPGEAFWTASWVIPKDHPTGTLSYQVTATDKKGRTAEWKPFSTAPSLPVVLDEVWPDVAAR